MYFLKLSKAEKKDNSDFFLKRLLGDEVLGFHNFSKIENNITICHLNEGDKIGPWKKGENNKIWLIKSGSLRPIIKVNKYNEISLDKCLKGTFLGFYENFCIWDDSYYLATEENTKIVGIPFFDLTEILNLSEFNNYLFKY